MLLRDFVGQMSRATRRSAAALGIAALFAQLCIPSHLRAAPAPAFSAAPTPPSASVGSAGTSVGESGDFAYRYPIEVPRGRLGAEPAISLAYSSSAPVHGSDVGQGWQISGVPSITADTSSSPLGRKRSYRSGLAGNAALIQVKEASTAGDVLETFRAEHDPSFARYELLRSSSPFAWRVRLSDGSEMYFGSREPTRQEEPLVHLIAPLARTVDRFGNMVEYEHRWAKMPTLTWQDPTDVTPQTQATFVELTGIWYGRNDEAGLQHHAYVRFDHSSSPVPIQCDHHGATIGSRVSYRTGELLASGVTTLATISTWAVRDGYTTKQKPQGIPASFQKVREYRLEHDATLARCDRLHAPRRVLRAIHEQAWGPTGAVVTKPPTRFDYGELLHQKQDYVEELILDEALIGQFGPLMSITSYGYEIAWRPTPLVHSLLTDMNGDGRLDRLEVTPRPPNDDMACMASWYENTGAGFEWRRTFFLPSLPWKGEYRDRFTELCSLQGQVTNYQPKLDRGGSNKCKDEQFGSDHYPSQLSYSWSDVDGDGAADLVMGAYRNPVKVGADDLAFATFSRPPPSAWERASDVSSQWADTVNDGFVDEEDECGLRPEQDGDGYLWYVFANDGKGNLAEEPEVRVQPLPHNVPASPSTSVSIDREKLRQLGFLDYNGDGYRDAAFHYGSAGDGALFQLEVFLGDEYGFFHGDAAGAPLVAEDYAPNDTGTLTLFCSWCPDGPVCGTSCAACPGSCWDETFDYPLPPGIMGSSHGSPDFASSLYRQDGFPDYDTFRPYFGFDRSRIDVNGDGLLDWLDRRGNMRLHTGVGLEPPVGGDWSDLSEGARDAFPYPAPAPAWDLLLGHRVELVRDYVSKDKQQRIEYGRSYEEMSWHDVDGDGLLDKVYVDYDPDAEVPIEDADYGALWAAPRTAPVVARVAYNLGGLGFLQPRPLYGAEAAFAMAEVRGHYGANPKANGFAQWQEQEGLTLDFDGDGYKDFVYRVDSPQDGYVVRRRVFHGKPPGLLTRITHEGGGTTDVEYASTADRGVVSVDPARGRVMRAGKWVVHRIENDPKHGQPTMAVEYTYADPVWNRDHDDRLGFRGFEQTAETFGDRVTRTRRSFDLVHSGLVVETVVETADDSPVVDTIESTHWEADAPFGVARLAAFYPQLRERVQCRAGQGYDACMAAGLRSRVETGTAPRAGGRLFVPAVTKHYVVDPGAPGAREERRYYKVRYTDSEYRMVVAGEQTRAVDESWSVELLSNVAYSYDAGYLAMTSRVEQRDELGNTARTEYVYDLKTGQKTLERAPNQVAEGSSAAKTTVWDELTHTYAERVTNELGHATMVVDYDYGLGLPLATKGPQYKCPDYDANRVGDCADWMRVYAMESVVVDGFGRPLEQYGAVDADTGYAQQRDTRYAYGDFVYESTGNPNVVGVEHLVDPNGGATTTATAVYRKVDGFGRTLSEHAINPMFGNAVTSYEYDAQGNVRRVSQPDPSASVLGDEQVTYEFSYDAFGRVAGMRVPDEATGLPGPIGLDTVYDGYETTTEEVTTDDGPRRQTVSVVNEYGELVEVRQRLDSGSYATWLYGYRGDGQIESIVDPDGVETRIESDWLGNRTAVERAGRRWMYAYDANGNLTHGTVPYPVGADPADYTSITAYDPIDRPVSEMPAGLGMSTEELADLRIGTTYHTYDRDSNALGERNRVDSPVGSVAFEYDVRGHATKATQSLASVFGLPASTRTTTFTNTGHVKEVTHADRTSDEAATTTRTVYQYDATGAPLRVTAHKLSTVKISLPWGNGVWYWPMLTSLGTVAELRRNPAGHAIERYSLFPGGDDLDDAAVSSFLDYTRRGQIRFHAALAGTGAAARIVAQQEWHWYDAGEPSQLQNLLDGRYSVFDYTFDDRHQLVTAVDTTGYDASLTYTTAGRIDTAAVQVPATALRGRTRDVAYRYAADNAEELERLELPDGSSFAELSYDDAGRVVARQMEGSEWLYTYDGANRLRVAEHPSGERERYFYLDGARVLAVREPASNAPALVRRWAFDTAMTYENGARTRAMVEVEIDDEHVATIVDSTRVEAAITSFQGHLLASVDGDGVVHVGHVFGPFGEVLAADGDIDDRTKGFNGKDYDTTSGWSYYGYRYYDADVLQWNRIDPMLRFAPDASLDEPRQQNLYTFSLNNPVSIVDPDGRFAQCGFNVDCMVAVVLRGFLTTMRDGYVGAAKSIAKSVIDTPKRAVNAGKEVVSNTGKFIKNPSKKTFGNVLVSGVKFGIEVAPLAGVGKAAVGLGRGAARALGRGAARGLGRAAAGSVDDMALGAIPAARGGRVAAMGPATPIYRTRNGSYIAGPKIMSELRRVGTPEALATSKLLKRGRVKLEIKQGGPLGMGGEQPFGTNIARVYAGNVNGVGSATSLAGHEAKHVMQSLTPRTYRLRHEFEAYKWQQRIYPEPRFSTDTQIWDYLNNSPLYRNVPR